MKPASALPSLLAAVLVAVLSTASVLAQDVIDLGRRRELFVDRYLLEKLDGAELCLQAPRDEGIVLAFDQPWEGKFCGYCTIIHDGPQFRAYYRGLPEANGKLGRKQVTCYAESSDGKTWSKPKLGLIDVQGSTKNNIVLAEEPFTHNFCPMLDSRAGVPAGERYKALGGSAKSGLVAFASADGLRWRKLRNEPVITQGAFDSQNVPLWSAAEQCYVCYFRVFSGGVRRIARVTSEDFLTWSKPALMEYGVLGDSSAKVPIEHLYTNQTSPYFRAPHISVAIAARFFPGKRVLTPEQAAEIGVDPKYFNDCSDGILMTTRGGNLYDRTFPEGFLRPGIGLENWTSRTNYPALNVVQTGPAELSLYVNQNYGQPTAHLHRYSLRLDGFASLQARRHGEATTRPLTFQGRELKLNFATSAGGSIRIELQDPAGKPLPGFALADCVPTIGNEIERAVRWKSGSDVSKLAGQRVRLRIELVDADVFSLQFE
jgi:hypothetical protein